MCQRSSAIIALISCNVYCDNNPECQLEAVQLCFQALSIQDGQPDRVRDGHGRDLDGETFGPFSDMYTVNHDRSIQN